jgi:uncharacterized protein DUF5667
VSNAIIEEILAECLERLEAGASVESCLAAFPGQAAELEPLLRMTQQVQSLMSIEPRPAFTQNARQRLENQLRMPQQAVTFGQPNRYKQQKPKLHVQRRLSLMQVLLALVLALTAGTGGVVYAAKASNPGDPLHGVELAMEQAQFDLTPGLSRKVELRIAFAEERLNEAQATFSKNDVTNGIEAMNEYGMETSDIAQLIGSANGTDQVALTALVESALSTHEIVLNNLLTKVPPQAQAAIQRALNASKAPFHIPASPPNGAGRPNKMPGPPAGIPGGPPNTVFCPTQMPVDGSPTNTPQGAPFIFACQTQRSPGRPPPGVPGSKP